MSTPPPEQSITSAADDTIDNDPLHRIYSSHSLESPAILSTVLGMLTKLLMLSDKYHSLQDILEYTQSYFEHLKLARASDAKIDFDRFLSTQYKILEKKIEKEQKEKYDIEKEFEPPELLVQLLTDFTMEVIRYQPQGDSNIFGFALEYFNTCVDSEDGSAVEFLRKQAKLAEEKQRILDVEKKRTELTKEKTKMRMQQASTAS